MFNLESLISRKHSQDFDFCGGGGMSSVSEKKKGKNKRRDDSEKIADDYFGSYAGSNNYTDPTQLSRDMTIFMSES